MSVQAHEAILGAGRPNSAVGQFLEEAAASHSPVVLLGEPGVGKEICARAIHDRSARSEYPFLIVDCSLYYERELRRELFGYQGVGGTGKTRQGLLEFAAQGTCYLSRIEELSQNLQERLLDFFRTGRFSRLGDGAEVRSDTRVIVSSDKNLEGFVEGGLFSRSLFDALAKLSFRVAPLRERRMDIGSLVEIVSDAYLRESPRDHLPAFTDAALDALACFPWPGNLVEFQKEICGVLEKNPPQVTPEQLSLEICSYWVGRQGDPEVRKVLEELDGLIREFRVLSRLDSEFGDVLLELTGWDGCLVPEPRHLGEPLL